MTTMWIFASNYIAGCTRLKNKSSNLTEASLECSDDEVSSNSNREEDGLECPICWESFNIVENVPYVLWCGHTLCKNCVLGLQSSVVKFPTLPIRLPLFISCPWCNLLSPRLIYKENLLFPRKNFFLLWMVESMNGDREESHSSFCGDRSPTGLSNFEPGNQVGSVSRRGSQIHHSELSDYVRANNWLTVERVHTSLRKSWAFFVQLTAKFPLVVVFLLIIVYAIPASAIILVLYVLITIVFALPSLLVLYFAYPCLDWLVREIAT